MLSLRKPTIDDMELFFYWVNDPVVREQSYDSGFIDFESHKQWFETVLNDESYFMYICQNSNREDIGQVRIQKLEDKNAIISVSIDFNYRGKGLAKEILILSTDSFFSVHKDYIINAYIKEDNLYSKFAFEKAGFEIARIIVYKNFKSYHLIKKNEK